MTQAMCNLCGGKTFQLALEGRAEARLQGPYRASHHAAGENFPLLRCEGCGLIFAWPRPTAEELTRYYANTNDAIYEDEAASRRVIAERQLDWMEHHGRPPGKRLLEIGALTGIFLAAARARGYEASGIEPSEWGRRVAREKYDLLLRGGDVFAQNFPHSSFDVVALMDVIEHLDDPRATMAEVARILAPGGLAFLLTPDIGHWRARRAGARWWGIQQSHLFYFSRASIAKLLETVGLRVLEFGAGPRVFTLTYWAKQLRAYNRPLGALCSALARGPMGRWRISLRFPDHMLVLAQKT